MTGVRDHSGENITNELVKKIYKLHRCNRGKEIICGINLENLTL